MSPTNQQELVSRLSFTRLDDLFQFETPNSNQPILLVVPAISVGSSELSRQYLDYLSQAGKVYAYFGKIGRSPDLFILGANHRGEGFIHQKGKQLLQQQYHIPDTYFVGRESDFRNHGYCSVEEAEVLRDFLDKSQEKFLIITTISQSQLYRYHLHHQGFGIQSTYFTFSDKADYYHQANDQQEQLLIKYTQKDPTWSDPLGQELRQLAHALRDPNFEPANQDYIDRILDKLTNNNHNNIQL